VRILLTGMCLVALWGGQVLRPLHTLGQVAAQANLAARGTPASEPPRGPLPVPYLAQSPLLCGGAAGAMVERFWGMRGVYAEDFRDLVREEEGGIRFSELAEELSERGWEVTALRYDPDGAAELVDRGFPVIALVESGLDRFHYVVLVDWTEEEVTFHDPSSSPSTVESSEAFVARWSSSEFRGLLIRPPPEGVPNLPGTAGDAEDVSNGDPGRGERGIHSPTDPLDESTTRTDWEMAHRRLTESRKAFNEGRYRAGETLAAAVAEAHPGNTDAWRLLAANRYLDGRHEAALSAWNRIDRPKIDLIRLQGVSSVDHATVLHRLGVGHREVLTSSKLTLAERRTSLIPAVAKTRADYAPNEDGSVQLDLFLWEASPPWKGWGGKASLILEAFTEERIDLDVPGLLGEGEAISIQGRWMTGRPMVGLTFATPSSPLPGIASVTGSWGQERYSIQEQPSGEWEPGDDLTEEWRSVALELTEWIRSNTRAAFTVRLDRWDRLGRFLGVGASGLTILNDARVGFGYDGTAWIGAGEGLAFHLVHLEGRWRSNTQSMERWRVEARSGVALAGTGAPRNLWPGAGVGIARPYLLRARPLLRGGGVRADGLGRGLWFGGVELFLQNLNLGLLRFESGVFSDAGQQWATEGPAAFHVDVGALVRLAIPGFDGWLQLSAARGLDDDASAVTLSWVKSWWPR